MKDLLYFETMLTPKFITLVYWLLLILVVLGGLGAIVGGQLLVGLGTIIFGCVGVRVWCELMIVMFKIHENIKRMADRSV